MRVGAFNGSESIEREYAVLRKSLHPADTYHLRDLTLRESEGIRVEDAVTVDDRQYHVCEVLRVDAEIIDRLRQEVMDAATHFPVDQIGEEYEYVVPPHQYNAVYCRDDEIWNVTGEQWPEDDCPETVNGVPEEAVDALLNNLETNEEFGVLIMDITEEEIRFVAAEHGNSEEHRLRKTPAAENLLSQ